MSEQDRLVMVICAFLRKNDALERYCTNVINYDKLHLNKNGRLCDRIKFIVKYKVRQLEHRGHPMDYVYDFFMLYDTAFDWGKAYEGVRYWSNLHMLWREFFNENRERYGL